MKKIFFVALMFTCVNGVFAQDSVNKTQAVLMKDSVYNMTDQLPEFPGGNSALDSFIRHNVHVVIPPMEGDIQGRTVIRVIVNTDGSLSDATIIKSSPHKECDAEALRVLALMPKFKPGIKNGKSVRVYCLIPILCPGY